ncbi:MAG TPA: alpha-2-macroglobulin family protein [Pyrinomonadaceae bacterium]|nr:alpha-2-macroglobulin family protein [Pyrinomonadaceae bacterium]
MKDFFADLALFSIIFGLIAPFSPEIAGQSIGRTREMRMGEIPPGLTFRLSEGSAEARDRVRQGPVPADQIDESEAASVLRRLPAIKSDPDDQTEFAKRVGTLPAPKTGRQLPVRFPADSERALPATGNAGKTVDVVRFSPEGEVSLAPDLSVTFSQPMVAVTSQEQAAAYAPVEITPPVEGRWRWLGTKTLMFDTDKRFPMATKFTVRVPAGTKAATGQTLLKDFSWTFTTPPPKVEQMVPQGQIVRRDALMFIRFDQAIDQAAVLNSINVSGGGRRLPLRLATQQEIDADGSISYLSKQAQPGRWIAFRAVSSDGSAANALPAASPITVNVEKGAPSAEGPLTTQSRQSFLFTTFGPFKYTRAYCGWVQKTDCTPFDAWYLEFSNPIDGSKFSKEMVKIEPPVDGLNIYPSGNNLYFQGYKKGNTTYKITVDGGLSDVFGQTIDRPSVATIKVGSAPSNFYAQGGAMVVLDPTARATFSIYSINQSAAKVKAYRVRPEDWHQYTQYFRRLNYDDGQRPAIPGNLISERNVPIKVVPDELVETRIDLSAFLNNGFGHVVLDIEPVERKDGPLNVYSRRQRVVTWIQATKLGLDAFVDNEELVGFATELSSGKPVPGVELSIYPNDGTVADGGISGDGQTEPSSMLDSIWRWFFGWGGSEDPGAEVLNSDGTTAESETIVASQSRTTGTNGVLRLRLAEKQSQIGQNLLIARRGADVAFLPENSDYFWQDRGSWHRRSATDSLRWFVFDDRGMYKPNEEVSVKGYIRKITGGKSGDVEGVGDSTSGFSWSVKDPRNNEIAKGEGNLNAFGAFDLKFKLPDNANLGYARIDLLTNSSVAGHSHSHQFQIQEFRRPEFEVTAKVETEAPHFVGGHVMLSVDAKYYAGGGLANADTNWTVTANPTNYTPPNRDDFTFGTWTPWWRVYDFGIGRPYGNGVTQHFKGVTDASGRHLLKIDFDSVKPPRPYTITANAAVQDVNRQTWAGNTSLLVHPADLYVGIRTPRTFVQKGENINIESIVTDIDGNLIGGREIEIKAVLKDWQFDMGSWQEVTVDEQTCTVKSDGPASSAGGDVRPSKCTFLAKAGGRYIITAIVMDDRERFNESEFFVWVPGGKQPPKRNVEEEEVQIIPSKKDFVPGETAELLVISPFTPAEGVLTLRREGIVKTERFSMKDSSITLKISLDEKYLPNINAQVDLVGSAARQNDKGEVDPKLSNRPAYASGNINLAISTDSRKLTVAAEAKDKTLAPGGETKVDVEVKDHRGEPVANSEVAVVIVDEAVLALSGYSVADPMSVFYTARGTGTTDHHLRKDVLLGNPDDVRSSPPPPISADGIDASVSETVSARKVAALPTAGRAAMELVALQSGVARDEASPDSPINLRENFDALAVWSPSVKTDSNGRATVNVKLPDNLTRYRITAVSVDQSKRFGKSESNITAKKPLMVRPSAPRFMNFGDRVELPVVVQNQTDQDMTVDVAIRATNAVIEGEVLHDMKPKPLSASGRRIVVKANDRAEVRFPVSTDKAGTARFQIAVTSGRHNDAAEISLPVWTPATTEAFATYGTTDQNGTIIQPVQAPADVYWQFGGLEVTTSSTQLQELTDAYIYLANYPYECSEQIASRMISTAALRDVLNAFKAKDTPTAAELEARFKRDIEILRSRQREDGSFGLWKRDRERYEYPFLTVHVAHALALAKAKGYTVPDDMLNKTKPYLSNIENHMKDQWHMASPQARWTISSYALYVRDLVGDKDAGKAKKLLAEAASSSNSNVPDPAAAYRQYEKMPFEALGWILSVLATDKGSTEEVGSMVRFLINRTTETAAAANFVTNYGDGGWLIMHSNRRADGVLLEAMIKAQPNNDLVPKLVRGLLAHRKKGHWGSTQENVFILLALDKYFNAFEKVTPDFVTRIWLGNTYAGEELFKGRSVDSNVLNIPMSYLAEQGGTSNLLIERQGAGRLYYRIGMKYAPRNLRLEPADYGFTVLRKYEAIDDKDDVKQNDDGSWTIRSGARVRVRLTMVAQARRYHVALVDQLPAGLEILNPSLATTEAIPPDAGGGNTSVVEAGSRSLGRNYYWWRMNWFEHQNFRDERAEAFSSLLWEGVYNYTYVARATTPGRFVVPPAKAEEMYMPETFGRTGTDFVRVE